MHTVELINLRKAYDKFVAVDALSLTIAPGTIYGLLGPNGAGKTSTIRMLIGITMPDSGEVRLFGEPFRREHLTRVGYLPEERGLYKKMKVIEHLIFLGEIRGLSAAEARKRSVAWSERLEIADWLPKKVEELSKGMQQKIQFIAALLHDPDFVIMDEPFSGLDPVNSALLKDVLVELKQKGKTIMFSTHRMDQVEKLCDSICLINNGKAVLQGELRQIKASYGKSNVHLEHEGASAFLEDRAVVHSYNNYGNFVEIRLAPGADAQSLLRTVSAGSRVNKFEVVEPSLEQIFIEQVGKNDA
jgi:ABC-2 type transport system ATP-binding protein